MLPTFVWDCPDEAPPPLTGAHPDQPGLGEKWDLCASSVELATAPWALADPVEQRKRLVREAWSAGKGDDEAMRLDEDFLRAVE